MYTNNVEYKFILDGLTTKLQPLDLSVNKVFKIFTDYVIFHTQDFFKGVEKPTRENILTWINEIWNSDNYLKRNYYQLVS